MPRDGLFLAIGAFIMVNNHMNVLANGRADAFHNFLFFTNFIV